MLVISFICIVANDSFVFLFQLYLQLLALGAGGQALTSNPLLSAVLASAATNQQNLQTSPGLAGLPNEMMQPNLFQSLLLLNSANAQPQMMNPQTLFNSQVANWFIQVITVSFGYRFCIR